MVNGLSNKTNGLQKLLASFIFIVPLKMDLIQGHNFFFFWGGADYGKFPTLRNFIKSAILCPMIKC
jgi:hypothetical protein